MALWTDLDFVTQADVMSVDADVVATATAQGIDVTTNLRRGMEEAGMFLEAQLISFATYVSSNDLSANHLAAVFYTGSQPNNRRRISLEQVVVDGRNNLHFSELKQWVVNRCLMFFYMAASSRAEGDRYENKLKAYRDKDVMTLWPLLKQSGVPIVYRPMPAPAATWAPRSGTWAASSVSASGNVTVGTFTVTVTYVDESKYIDQLKNGNAESQPAATKNVVLAADNGIQVDVADLVPPNGAVSNAVLARGVVVPLNATGWNVWVGAQNGTLRLQNASPIPIATKTYQLAGDPVLSGYAVGIGQYVEAYLTIPNLVQRG